MSHSSDNSVTDKSPRSFAAAIMHYFGKKPGQTTGEFVAEIKALTAQDKVDLTAELTRIGYVIAA